jgi:hypothetical protein
MPERRDAQPPKRAGNGAPIGGGLTAGPKPAMRAENGPAYQPRTGPNRAQGNNNGNGGNGGLGSELRPGNTIIPHFLDNKGKFSARLGDESQFQNKLRWGYYNRDPRWRDWHFGYGYYCYRPIPWQCSFSPYYWYWSVPGYLPWNRCHYGRPTIIIILAGFVNWNYCGYGSSFYNTSYYNYSALDRSLSDLKDAFLYKDYRSLDRLVPSGGSIEIFIDGEYAYSIDASDYYDITADLIYSVETTDFDIVDVRRLQGNRGYVAVGRHEFIDSWGARQETYLSFTLQPNNGRYQITQAGTQRNRPF